MLSVDVPARVSIALLGPDAEHASSLLAYIPAGLELVDAEPSVVSHGSAAWELWDMLIGYDKVGPTTASKLMARKRPNLIPIHDSVVLATLRHAEGSDFWASTRGALLGTVAGGGTLSNWLRRAQDAAGIAPDISELRVFDVLGWLHGKRA
jgi:hypothetical protein